MIRQGSIFWLDDCPPLDGREEKRRPVVSITNTALTKSGDPVIVAACSASVTESDPTRIQLPDKGSIPSTKSGLAKVCWLVPRWFLIVEQDRLNKLCGYLTGKLLARVVDEVEKALAEKMKSASKK